MPYDGSVTEQPFITAAPRRHPRKSLGQHWLVDKRYVSRIVAAADIQPDETVVEIGPGTGALTGELARQASHLIAVEVDRERAEMLSARFLSQAHVTIICADVLSLKAAEILAQAGARPPYTVVGNLPYYIGTAILRHFLRDATPPAKIIATLQAEVAQNIAAPPGDMSYLSVEMQLFAQAQLKFRIPPRAFRPAPNVHSAVVRLDPRPLAAVSPADRDAFLEFAQAGFAAPRKQLRNSLAVGLRVPPERARELLDAAEIDAKRRPETLALQEWVRLFSAHRAR